MLRDRGLLSLCILIALALPAGAGLRVIDGDTIVIGAEHVRIANIDAPEIRRARCVAERLLGIEARRRLTVLLSSGRVSLSRGWHGRRVDRWGRTLAFVLVDGRDVGAVLVAERLARPWDGRRHPWCA